MAINRGALLAQTYQLPAAQAQQQAPAPTPFQDEIGDPASGLQQIDGVTSEYFQKWAALKGFAKDVQENLGIDVRFPDPSVPESDRLHRIYLKSLADLKAQGERLKTGQQMYMADRQRGALMTKDPSSTYYDQMDVGNDVIDKELDPIVTEANDKLKGPYYYGDNSIKEARAYYNQVKTMLENRKKTDAGNAGYWQKQIDALVMPTESEKQWNPNTGGSDKGYTRYQAARIKAADTFMKKMTNLQKGTADSFQMSDTIFGENGERIFVSEDTKNERYGGKDVVRYEFNPTTKRTSIVLKEKGTNGGTDKISRVDITDTDPMTHAKGYVSDNSKYAANGEYLDIAAEEMEYLDPNTGEVNFKNLLAADAETRYGKMGEASADPEAMQTVQAAQQIKSIVSTLKPGVLWDDTHKFNIKGGKALKVEANKSDTGGVSFEVVNWKELGLNKDQVKNMSQEELEKLLFKMEAHKHLNAPSGTKAAPTPSTKPAVNRKEVL